MLKNMKVKIRFTKACQASKKCLAFLDSTFGKLAGVQRVQEYYEQSCIF